MRREQARNQQCCGLGKFIRYSLNTTGTCYYTLPSGSFQRLVHGSLSGAIDLDGLSNTDNWMLINNSKTEVVGSDNLR